MQIVRQELHIRNLPPSLDGVVLAQLTDIHRCRFTKDSLLHEAVSATLAEKPHIVVLTGDYVTEEPADIAPCAEILAPLKAELGCYFIIGNHDYTTDAPRVQSALEGVGLIPLINRNICLEGGLWIAGLDDDRYGSPDYAQALQDIPAQTHFIALCHNPRMVEDLAEYDCTVLSGHTHGGQVVVPFLTAWKIRHIGSKNYRAGWYPFGKARVYVSRGLGNVAIPLRFLAPPEVTFFTLRSAP